MSEKATLTTWPTFDPEVRKHFVLFAHQPKVYGFPAGKKKEVRATDPKLFDAIAAELREEGLL